MSENQNAIRAALLRFYHSDLTAHAGYLITSTVATITFFANYGNIRELQPLPRIFDQWPITERALFTFAIAGFLFLQIFLLTGVLWWAYLANAIIHLESQEEHPTFHSLQMEAAEFVRGTHQSRRSRRTWKESVSTWSRSSWWNWFFVGIGLWLLLLFASYWVEVYLLP